MRGITPVLAGILLFASLVHQTDGDCYMHNPRGSNNRLNEKSANRDNANRMFDSQNNNRGGYNTGDQTDQPFSDEAGIYYMKYFQSASVGRSFLTTEWTNQHGCGGNDDNDPHKLNCNVVIQYTCQEESESESNAIANGDADTLDVLRDGENRGTQEYNAPNNLDEDETQYNTRRTGSVSTDRGLHETFSYYDDCYVRERNTGLFLADQRLNRGQTGNLGYFGARFTRQNPNANRRGYECPEERDYYPYWHPTPWRDVAVLVDDDSRCPLYRAQSFNVQPRYLCREKFDSGTYKPISRWNNETGCTANGGEWTEFYNYLEIDPTRNQVDCETGNTESIERKWARPYPDMTMQCLILLKEPDCQQVGWTRVNHLGNSRSGYPLNYTMELPYFMDGMERRCVLRIRYNISTDDYDPWTTDSALNEDRVKRIRSPVTQNPYVDVGSITNGPLKLAINTAQFGRTFQDRSHVYILKPRPTQGSLNDQNGVQINDVDIYNVNVRGKRGNIVQVYPAVEYDFVPNRLYISEDDVVHFQWTGSNTHNNQNPAGDGQAGDAGEGRDGTDRHNIVQLASADMNYPLPFENTTLFNSQVVWYDRTNTYTEITLIPTLPQTPKNLALLLASDGYYQCFQAVQGCTTNSVENKDKLNNLLDNAFASFYGPILKFSPGTYNYTCTRNNNFTNRSQKGFIVVRPSIA